MLDIADNNFKADILYKVLEENAFKNFKEQFALQYVNGQSISAEKLKLQKKKEIIKSQKTVRKQQKNI